MAPRLTFVLVAHREQAFLEPCLASILGQDVRDLEVVAIDDASDDHVPELLDAVAARDPRVRVEHLRSGRARRGTQPRARAGDAASTSGSSARPICGLPAPLPGRGSGSRRAAAPDDPGEHRRPAEPGATTDRPRDVSPEIFDKVVGRELLRPVRRRRLRRAERDLACAARRAAIAVTTSPPTSGASRPTPYGRHALGRAGPVRGARRSRAAAALRGPAPRARAPGPRGRRAQAIPEAGGGVERERGKVVAPRPARRAERARRLPGTCAAGCAGDRSRSAAPSLPRRACASRWTRTSPSSPPTGTAATPATRARSTSGAQELVPGLRGVWVVKRGRRGPRRRRARRTRDRGVLRPHRARDATSSTTSTSPTTSSSARARST